MSVLKWVFYMFIKGSFSSGKKNVSEVTGKHNSKYSGEMKKSVINEMDERE